MKINFYFILRDGGIGQYLYKYPYSVSCIGGQNDFGTRHPVQSCKLLKTKDLWKSFGRGIKKKIVPKRLFCFTKLSVFWEFAAKMTGNSLFFLCF
jgi:hypothetical protein